MKEADRLSITVCRVATPDIFSPQVAKIGGFFGTAKENGKK